MRPKHGLFLFITSCIPGCGQMHQGYMKRGISLLTAFCGVFALALFLEIGSLTVLMVPLWLYSFFDSYNLRARITDGTAEEDAYLFGMSDMDKAQMGALLRKRHSLIGWGLVVLGLYLLWQRVADWLDDIFAYIFGDRWSFYYLFHHDIPRLVVTFFIIALGVWFIRGPKKMKGEDIPSFTPPAEEAAEPGENGAAQADAEQEDAHGDD